MTPRLTWKLAFVTLSCIVTVSCVTPEPSDLSVGSIADVKSASHTIKTNNSRNASDYEWLLNQIGLRCVQENGGSVPKAAFERPPRPKTNENTRINAWLGHAPLALTKGAQKIMTEREQQDTKPSERPQPKLDVASEALLNGAPKEYFEQTSMDGTKINYVVSGCVGTAIQRVFGVEPRVYYTTDLKIGDIARMTETVKSVPALGLVEERYKECMKEAGQVVKNIDTPPEILIPVMTKVIEENGDLEELRKLETVYDNAAQACKKQERVAEVYAHHYLKAVDKATNDAQSAIAAHKEMSEHAAKVRKEYLAKYHS